MAAIRDNNGETKQIGQKMASTIILKGRIRNQLFFFITAFEFFSLPNFVRCQTYRPNNNFHQPFSAPTKTSKSNNKIPSSSTTALQQPKYKLSSIYSESAIIDQETGQVFWQNGSPSLSDTLSLTGLEKEGDTPHSTSAALSSRSHAVPRHVKSAVLSLVIWMNLLNKLKRYLITNPFISLSQIQEQYPKNIYLLIKTIFVVFGNLILPPNPFAPWFFYTCIFLYFLEALTCNTRRYLSNALSSSEEMEQYIDSLRQTKPNVIWKVRCFHYEQNHFQEQQKPHESDYQYARNNTMDIDAKKKKSMLNMPRVLPKKVITHTATKQYEFEDWNDQTIMSLWKRAPVVLNKPSSLKSLSIPSSTTAREGSLNDSITAPYTKISFSKFLILGNTKAREDYFQQQRDFVRKEAYKDQYTEFFTDIQVDGFKSKILAHRTIPSSNQSDILLPTSSEAFQMNKASKLHSFRFYIYTLLGLTLPFRLWLDRQCDTICVTLVKETYALKRKKKKKRMTSNKDSYWSVFSPTTSNKYTEKNNTATLFDESSAKLASEPKYGSDRLVIENNITCDNPGNITNSTISNSVQILNNTKNITS